MPIEDVYALSKLCNEQTAAMYTRRVGMATTCLRLGWVVDLSRPPRWARRQIENAPTYRDDGLWSYIEVRDAGARVSFGVGARRKRASHLLLTARDFRGELDYREQIEKFYPELAQFLSNGFDYARYGFWDTRPATELLGWESRFHWREAFEALEAS